MRQYKTFPLNAQGRSYHMDIDRAHPNIITGGDPDRINLLATNFLDDAEFYEKRGLLTVHGFYGRERLPVTAFSTGMGPSSVCATLPEVVEACDEDNMLILRIGTAGGIKPFLAVGDYLVTDSVFHDEDVSRKIMGAGYQAWSSEDFKRVVADVARRNPLPGQIAHVGQTVTSNLIYFGEDENLERFGRSLGISMEFGVIGAIRDWYNANTPKRIRAANLLGVSNMLVPTERSLAGNLLMLSKEEIEMAHIITGLDALVEMRKLERR